MIAAGHPPAQVWDYTPLQAEAFLWLTERRQRHDRAHDLAISALAHRGDIKDVNRRIRKDFADP